MDTYESSADWLPEFRRSYARLAVWMVRNVRGLEPSRLREPIRVEEFARVTVPSRSPLPARP